MKNSKSWRLMDCEVVSTSSSLNFSPRVVSKCLSSAVEIWPDPSLSKWRRPSTKSSVVSKLLRLQMAWKIIYCNFRNVSFLAAGSKGPPTLCAFLHYQAHILLYNAFAARFGQIKHYSNEAKKQCSKKKLRSVGRPL